jgi:hypothetical protein
MNISRANLIGLELVLANLNKEIAKISGRTTGGLLRAVALVRVDMEKTPPKTPVDTGNLRASFITVPNGGDIVTGADPTFSDVGSDGTIHKGKAARDAQHHATVMAEVVSEASKAKYPMVIFGYTVSYAAYVHENMEAKNWSRPESGPKFLESAINRNYDKMLQVIREEAKIL